MYTKDHSGILEETPFTTMHYLRSRTVKNINKAKTAWIREGLGGGDFEDWKPNGGMPPDAVLKQLTIEEQVDLHKTIQIAQSINPKKPSSSS